MLSCHPISQASISCQMPGHRDLISPQVGFIGLGAMGARQARNLQREGYDLVVYDRSISRLDEYSKRDNVEVASSPAAVAATEGRLSRNLAISTTPAQCLFHYQVDVGRANALCSTGVRVLITMLPACKHVREAYCGRDGILAADGTLYPLTEIC